MKYSNNDISDYYSQTFTHYKTWWKLSQTLAVHYGIWDENTRNFSEALINTNRKISEFGEIEATSKVLDAGCGVGGTSFFVAEKFGCQIHGITLSQKQLEMANQHREGSPVKDLTKFSLMDYTKTDFEDETFDVILCCESVCHANPKESFLKEAYRVLKPEGRLVVCDYFLTEEGVKDPQSYIKKWGDCWAISQLNVKGDFEEMIENHGFSIQKNEDYTRNIFPSSKKMYQAYLLGAIPSMLYNATHKTSRFARTHYLSGKYQYLALKRKQWEYRIIEAVKR